MLYQSTPNSGSLMFFGDGQGRKDRCFYRNSAMNFDATKDHATNDAIFFYSDKRVERFGRLSRSNATAR